MASLQVGFKKKKQKNTELTTLGSINAPNSGKIADVSAVDSGTDMDEYDSLNQKLQVEKNRADAANAAKKAKERAEKMKNRNWFEKLIGYDPDANFFSNLMSGLFFGFREADNAIFALGNAIQGDTKTAKEIFSNDWNKGETYGVTDFLTNTAHHLGMTDATRFSQTKLGKSAGGKLLGIGADILGDPTQLALMMIPGVGEAEVASRIAARAAEFASKGVEVGKVAKGAEEGAKALEGVNDIAKGEKVAESAEDIAKTSEKVKTSKNVADRLDEVGTTEKGLPHHIDTVGGKESFNANIRGMKQSRQLQEGLKGNAVYESIFEEGAKRGFDKSWEKAARNVYNYHDVGVASGKVKDTASFLNHMNSFDTDYLHPAGILRRWSKRSKGRTNLTMKRGHVAKQLMEWMTMSPLKTLGLGKRGLVKILDKVAVSGGTGHRLAGMTKALLTPIESGGARLFNRNKNKSQELISAGNQAETTLNDIHNDPLIKRAAQIRANTHEIANYYTHHINGTLTPAMEKKMRSIKIDSKHNLYDVVQDLAKGKGANKDFNEVFNDIKSVTENDAKDSFSALKPDLKKMWEDGDFRESNILGQVAKRELENEGAARNAARKDFLERAPELKKSRDRLEAALDAQGYSRDAEKFFSRYKGMTQEQRNNFLRSYMEKGIKSGRIDLEGQEKVAQEIMGKVDDATSWRDLPRTEKEFVRQFYKKAQRTIEYYGKDEDNAFGRHWLRDTGEEEWKQIQKVMDTMRDNTDWKESVEQNVFGKYTDRDVTQTKNFKTNHPDLYEAERRDVTHRLQSNVVEQQLNQWISQSLAPGLNKKVTTDTIGALSDMAKNGNYYFADRGGTTLYQNQRLSQTMSQVLGEKITPKQVTKRLDALENSINTLKENNTFKSAYAKGIADKTLTQDEAYAKAIGALREENPELAAQFDQYDEIQNEIYALNEVGSKNTQEFMNNFDKYVLDSYADRELENYEKEMDAAAEEKVKADYDKAIKKEQTQIDKINEKLKSETLSDSKRANLQADRYEHQTKIDQMNGNLANEEQLATEKNALKEKGFDNFEPLAKKRESLFKDRYRNLRQSSDALARQGVSRGTPFNPMGRYLELGVTGKNAVQDILNQISNDPELSEIFQSVKKAKALTDEQRSIIAEKLHTDPGVADFLMDGFTQDSFGRLDAETAAQMGRITDFKNIKSLNETANELRNLNASIPHMIAERLGISVEDITTTSGWFRQLATEPYAARIVHDALSLEEGSRNANKLFDSVKKLTKTINLNGLDANRLFGDSLMQFDPINAVADKFGLVYDQLRLKTFFDAMLKGGDMDVIPKAKATQYIERLRQSAANSSVKKLGKEFVQNNAMAYENGKYIIRANELLKSLGAIKNIMKGQEWDSLVNVLKDRIGVNMGQDYLKQFADDEELFYNAFVQVPEQLQTMLNQHAVLFNPEENIARGFLTKMIGAMNKVWKQFALLSGGYLLRNNITAWYNHYLAGLPLDRSIVERARAGKDIWRWLGGGFAGKTIKKGLKYKFEQEMMSIARTQGKRLLVDREKVLKRMLLKGTITEKDADFMREMLTMQDKSVVGMFKVHSDFNNVIGHSKALGERIQKSKFMRAAKAVYGKTIGAVTDLNMSLAARQDDAARLATYRMLEKDPALMEKLGFSTADEGTRFINFDFQNMTAFERTRMRNIIPFYTYMRQSFAFHLKNIAKFPTRYYNIMRNLNKMYDEYANDVDQNGIPTWMRSMFYVPFQFGGSTLGVFKANLPFNDLMNVTNLIGGGLASFSGGIDTLEATGLKQSATNFLGQVNPLFKAAADTMFGESSFGGESNHSNFFSALGQELGGVFTRLPQLVADAVNSGDTNRLQSILDNLFGLTKHYDQKSIKTQRIYELINYIESELQKHSGYVMSYQRARERMYGTAVKSMNGLKKPTVVRVKKRRKKHPKLYSDSAY